MKLWKKILLWYGIGAGIAFIIIFIMQYFMACNGYLSTCGNLGASFVFSLVLALVWPLYIILLIYFLFVGVIF